MAGCASLRRPASPLTGARVSPTTPAFDGRAGRRRDRHGIWAPAAGRRPGTSPGTDGPANGPPAARRRARSGSSGRRIREPVRAAHPVLAASRVRASSPRAARGGDGHSSAPWPSRDPSAPSAGHEWMLKAARDGVGQALARHLRETGAPLIATFYAAPILAELHGAQRLALPDHRQRREPRLGAAVPERSADPLFRACRFAPAAAHGELRRSPRAGSGATGYPLARLPGRQRSARGDERTSARACSDSKAGPSRPWWSSPSVGRGRRCRWQGARLPAARRPILDGVASVRARRAGTRPEVATALRAALSAAGLASHPGASFSPSPPSSPASPVRRAACARRRALEQAVRADLLRGAGTALHRRAARRRARALEPALGGGLRRRARAARPLRRRRVAARMAARRSSAAAADAGMRHLPRMGLYEIVDQLGRG